MIKHTLIKYPQNHEKWNQAVENAYSDVRKQEKVDLLPFYQAFIGFCEDFEKTYLLLAQANVDVCRDRKEEAERDLRFKTETYSSSRVAVGSDAWNNLTQEVRLAQKAIENAQKELAALQEYQKTKPDVNSEDWIRNLK